MFETKSNKGKDGLRVWQVVGRVQEPQHLLIYMSAIRGRIFNRGPRLRATPGALDTRTEAFVIGIEVEEKVVGISPVPRQVSSQHSLKKP